MNSSDLSQKIRVWAMVCHVPVLVSGVLSLLVAYVAIAGSPRLLEGLLPLWQRPNLWQQFNRFPTWKLFEGVVAFAGILLAQVIGLILIIVLKIAVSRIHPFVNRHARVAMNFLSTMTLASVVSLILFTLLAWTVCGGRIFTLIPATTDNPYALTYLLILIVVAAMILAFAIFQLWSVIAAAKKAYQGQDYRYPYTIHYGRN